MKSSRQTRNARFGLNQRGASLIETVVSLGLFAISAATMGDFLVQQVRANTGNYNHTTAYSLAAEEFEDIRNLDYDSIASRTTTRDDGAIRFTIGTTVLPDTPEENMKQITVDVGWNEPGGSRHVTLHSIYTSIRR
jgi:Tfp pilus assembly protein PilV